MFDHPQRCTPDMPSRAEPGRLDCHPERRAQPIAEGSAGHSRQISPLPPEDPLARLLSPVASKLLPPRSLQPFFRARWTSNLTTSHAFPAPSPAVVTETGPPRMVLPDSCARDAISDAIPSGTGGFDCHPGCKQGPPRLSSRAEGAARSRGICMVTQADFSAPSGRSK